MIVVRVVAVVVGVVVVTIVVVIVVIFVVVVVCPHRGRCAWPFVVVVASSSRSLHVGVVAVVPSHLLFLDPPPRVSP
eukprot:158899-Pyramimonas_sp.AAC.1